MKKLEVKCPHCEKKFNYYQSEFRPFCCEKCRLLDLGKWLDQSYTVPANKISEEEFGELQKAIMDEED